MIISTPVIFFFLMWSVAQGIIIFWMDNRIHGLEEEIRELLESKKGKKHGTRSENQISARYSED